MGKIIWLASFPRSGNTWVRSFLAVLFMTGDKAYDINALEQFAPNLTARGLYEGAAGGPVQDMPLDKVLSFRGHIQNELSKVIADSAFIKTHSRFGEQFKQPLISPEHTAGAIYIVRNPLDVAVSAASYYGVSTDEMVRQMANPEFALAPDDRNVTDYVGSWSRHVATWTAPAHPRLHIIRYEDLHADPVAHFTRLVQFLGLKTDAGQVERAAKFSSFATLAEQEKRSGFVERLPRAKVFFRRGRPGEGREVLKPAQIEAITTAHREHMTRFGYQS